MATKKKGSSQINGHAGWTSSFAWRSYVKCLGLGLARASCFAWRSYVKCLGLGLARASSFAWRSYVKCLGLGLVALRGAHTSNA